MSVETLDWDLLGLAIALLVLATVLLILEFFVVSMGLLLASSIACVAGALYFAFAAGNTTGWLFVIATPVIATLTVRWGIQRIRTSRLVPQDEVTAEAGYHHVADRLGVSPGSLGVMVTPAHPSGRARFDGGECDVQAQSRALDSETRVVVKRIDGPIIFVAPINEGAE